jgi:hypothetical protein
MENDVNGPQEIIQNIDNVQNLEKTEKDLEQAVVDEKISGEISDKSDSIDKEKEGNGSESPNQKEELYTADSDEITDEERSSIVS